MALSVSHTSGGTYNGSGGAPSNGNSGGLNGVAGDVIVIACYTGRALASGNFDTHSVASITSAGLTFTKIVDQSYQYQEASGSFPAASCHVDVFRAVVGSTLVNQAWSGTMAAAGDTFVNDSWCTVVTISGADTTTILDPQAPNPENATNVTLTASTPSINFDTSASADIIFFLAFMHTVGAQATSTIPTGYTAAGHFKSQGANATWIDGSLSYKIVASPQSGAIAMGTSDNCWFASAFAIFEAGAVVANTKRSFVTVVN